MTLRKFTRGLSKLEHFSYKIRLEKLGLFLYFPLMRGKWAYLKITLIRIWGKRFRVDMKKAFLTQ